jgi:CheY-like chemotaxis protein
LRKLVEHKPDVIVLDIMMDYSTDGYGVNQAIKYQDAYAEFRSVPIIMVSSIRESPDELFPMAAEVEMIRPDNYLTKPLDIPKFLDVLETVAARLPARKAGAAQ